MEEGAYLHSAAHSGGPPWPTQLLGGATIDCIICLVDSTLIVMNTKRLQRWQSRSECAGFKRPVHLACVQRIDLSQ